MSDQIAGLAEGINGHAPNDVLSMVEHTRLQFEAMLAAKREEKATILARHEQELAGINDELTILSNTVRALTGKPLKEPKLKKQPGRIGVPQANGTATGFGVTIEAASEAADFIRTLPQPFTQAEFYRGFGVDQGKGSGFIRYLRHIDFLRKAGVRADAKGKPELWAIMDDQAVEKVRQAAQEAAEQAVAARTAPPEDPDRFERVVSYLKDHGVVMGWATVAHDCGIPKGSIDLVKGRLIDGGLVKVGPSKAGQKTRIEFINEGEGGGHAPER